jgi:hypothetical protein
MALRLVSGRQRTLLATTFKEELQRRAYWQEVVRVKTNKDGKNKHEDPERVVQRFQDQRRSDGSVMLDIHAYNDKHEKAWMKRKRMNDKRRYDFDKRHVMELAKYIQFVQDNKEK